MKWKLRLTLSFRKNNGELLLKVTRRVPISVNANEKKIAKSQGGMTNEWNSSENFRWEFCKMRISISRCFFGWLMENSCNDFRTDWNVKRSQLVERMAQLCHHNIIAAVYWWHWSERKYWSTAPQSLLVNITRESRMTMRLSQCKLCMCEYAT